MNKYWYREWKRIPRQLIYAYEILEFLVNVVEFFVDRSTIIGNAAPAVTLFENRPNQQ